MKKITLLAAVIVAITFASCKKDRVCTCRTDQPGSTDDKVTYIDAKKGDARANCLSSTYTYTYSSTPVTTTTIKTTCTLD